VTGTAKFVLTPEDAEIRVDGATVHTGSPWTTELPTGMHRIEIRKPSYKSWVTSIELSANETQWMRVVLEPVTQKVADTATLKITTTPADLDVVIDGEPFAKKTPIATTLTAGTHKIVVKKNGVEVWQQTVNAEPQSDYEFNPSIERRAPPRPAPASVVAPSHPIDAAPPADASGADAVRAASDAAVDATQP
jgi:hypothetical protein